MELNRAQTIEFFHIAFLTVLGTRLDPARYVLKGGANLRYFFASERYSEDIDLDLVRPVPWSFAEQVEGTLTSPALRRLLGIGGLTLADHANTKETETTHRWKIEIEAAGMASAVRSKIEFSNLGTGDGYSLASVSESVVAPYALRPPAVQHYDAQSALVQKVEALAGRPQTQGRDVFDLELLLRRGTKLPDTIETAVRDAALERALEQDYAAFRDQVLPFLEPSAAELVSSPAAWEQIQTFVAGKLEVDR